MVLMTTVRALCGHLWLLEELEDQKTNFTIGFPVKFYYKIRTSNPTLGLFKPGKTSYSGEKLA
jgi:hypothetical protein